MTAIDVEKLRAEHPTMRSKDAWELLPALLDEVERLRGEHSVMVIQAKDARAQQRKAERERDEARAQVERLRTSLYEVEEYCEHRRRVIASHEAQMRSILDAIPSIVREAFNAGVIWQSDDKETLSTRSAAEQRAAAAALAAIQALGISKQCT